MNEVWKSIKGFSHYEVSSEGRVKSKARDVVLGGGKLSYQAEERMLKSRINGKRRVVALYKDGKGYSKTIKSLVDEAFKEAENKRFFASFKVVGDKLMVNDHKNITILPNTLRNKYAMLVDSMMKHDNETGATLGMGKVNAV